MSEKIALKIKSIDKPKILKGDDFTLHRQDDKSSTMYLKDGTKILITFHVDEFQYIIWDVDKIENQ